ncbi:MAG: manganese efflux pump MntP family protein [Acidaminococcaceae bacterium]|jgi:putative Mn2+ efflux pump MntP|nr:manganese efflux pump MntP family protein [Acidaminococcaceae bacterium]
MDGFLLLLLAISLSMDAFAVAVCGGMGLAEVTRKKAMGVRFGLWFGSFQALMPIVGYYAAFYFRSYIENYDHWVAFVLLCYLGIGMLRPKAEGCPVVTGYTNKKMCMLAIATSIDALAIGISLALLGTTIFMPALVIGLVTFALSYLGCLFGTKIGALGQRKAECAGGFILICIGCKVLFEHLMG